MQAYFFSCFSFPGLTMVHHLNPTLENALNQHCGPEWRRDEEVLKALAAFYGEAMSTLTKGDVPQSVASAIGKDIGGTYNALTNICGDLEQRKRAGESGENV